MLPDRLPGSLLLQIGLLLFDLCHCCVDLAFGQSTVVAVAELAGVVPLRVVGGHAAKGSPVEVRGRVCVLPLEKKRHRVVVLPPGTLVLVAIEIDHPKQQPAVQLVRSKPAQPVGESSMMLSGDSGKSHKKCQSKFLQMANGGIWPGFGRGMRRSLVQNKPRLYLVPLL